jgi:hypothetical protein
LQRRQQISMLSSTLRPPRDADDAYVPKAGIFEPQNLRQSAVAFHVGG